MYDIGLKLWSVNTGAYLREAGRMFADGMIGYVELFVVPDTTDTLGAWRGLHAESGVPFVIHNAHAAQGFNLADRSAETRNREIYLQTRRFADVLDAGMIIFHGGIDGTAEETAAQLASFGESRAVLENKPFVPLPNSQGACFCRGATESEIGYIISETGCGFCLDVGHAVCAANSQGFDPYGYLKTLMRFRPAIFHLSDITDMTSPYDAHPHLGTGKLDIPRLKREILPPDAMVSIETVKDDPQSLDDFSGDIQTLLVL